MKSTFLRMFVGLSLAGSLGMPVQAGKVAVLKTVEIQKTLDDLKKEIIQMREYAAKSNEASDDLTTRILGPDGRQMTENVIDLDLPIAENYRSEAWNDIGWLKNHWKELTSDQRNEVQEAQTTLE